MSHQDEIYNQTGYSNRNQTLPVVNTSSDICVFNIPFFTMSGASKADCPTQSCTIDDLSTIISTQLSSTTQCFIDNGLSGSCFNDIVWSINIYEDNILANSGNVYTSTTITETPAVSALTNGFDIVFTGSGYDYTRSGTTISVKQDGFANLSFDLVTEINYDANCPVTGATTGETYCSCPPGTTATTGDDGCQTLNYTAATTGGTFYTATTGSNASRHGYHGLIILEDITDKPWPIGVSGTTGNSISVSGTNFTVDASSTPVAYQYGGPGTGATYIGYLPKITNSLWGNSSSTLGRLNEIGIFTTSSPFPINEWIGFSQCIEIETTDTYYVGIAADDRARFFLDNELVYQANAYSGAGALDPYVTDFRAFTRAHWVIFPLTITSGKHIVTIEGENGGSVAAFGGEIYSGTTAAALAAMTASTQLEPYIIFSTIDYTGQTFQTGESSGYGCPSGYTYDPCLTGTPTCVEIINSDLTCVYTGTCSAVTTDLCGIDYSASTNADNVHVLTGQTEINLDFTFTANTSEFVDKNTLFSFEVYKYNHDLGYFTTPPVYISSAYTWSSFSATSAFTTSVPVDSLNADGDYLIKGFYQHDICTEFALLNNGRMTTPTSRLGSEYRLYEPYRDFYMVAFTTADTPEFVTGGDESNSVGSLLVASEILNGTDNTINLPISENDSDYIIALNGLTLAKDIDYSIVGISDDFMTANLSGTTVSGDIVTYIYTNGSGNLNTFRVKTIDVTSIPSGPLDGQGNNDIYYNTSSNKYEIYTDYNPLPGSDIIVTVNGVTLANGIDYYQSTSNEKRIILQGTIIVSDIINIYYNVNNTAQGNINNPNVTVSWVIENPPQTTDGIFTVEVADSQDFTNIITSAQTGYIINEVSYSSPVTFSGNAGDTVYYRVKNEKSYRDLCGNALVTSAYSDIIDITIQTNTLNSY